MLLGSLLRSARRSPLAKPAGVRLRDIAHDFRRRLQNAPQPVKLSPPIGLVDFIGFDDKEHLVQEPSPAVTRHIQDVVREREARIKDDQNRTLQHPSFQPLIRVANEVSELELAGALLDKVRRKWGERLIGKRYLLGGGLEYVDPQSGREVYRPVDAHGQVSAVLSPPSFAITHKEAVMAGRRYDDYVVEEADVDCWDATEAELDEIACTSPYFKLTSTRSCSLDPAGTFTPTALLEDSPLG